MWSVMEIVMLKMILRSVMKTAKIALKVSYNSVVPTVSTQLPTVMKPTVSKEILKFMILLIVVCPIPWQAGDGLCHPWNNVKACLYDDGDCL